VRRGRRRGEILIGGPAGERHVLPLAMLADLLRLEGWEVFDLGADTPANSFVHAASKINNLTAVGVSVSTPDSLAGAADVVRALRQAMADEVPVVLGGNAIRDLAHAQELGGDFFAEGARGFIDFLDGLAGGRTGRTSADHAGNGNGKSGNGKSSGNGNGKSSGNGKSGNSKN